MKFWPSPGFHFSKNSLQWWFFATPLKNDGVRQWEGWHPMYEMGKKMVPNHQPGLLYHMYEMEHKLIMFETTKRGSRWHSIWAPSGPIWAPPCCYGLLWCRSPSKDPLQHRVSMPGKRLWFVFCVAGSSGHKLLGSHMLYIQCYVLCMCMYILVIYMWYVHNISIIYNYIYTREKALCLMWKQHDSTYNK